LSQWKNYCSDPQLKPVESGAQLGEMRTPLFSNQIKGKNRIACVQICTTVRLQLEQASFIQLKITRLNSGCYLIKQRNEIFI